MAYASAEARQELLDAIADTADDLAVALAGRASDAEGERP